MTDPKFQQIACVHTDLVGTTALLSAGTTNEFDVLMDRHRELVGEYCQGFAGRIIDNPGDGHFLTFDTSSDAVLFALALQQAHAADPASDLPPVRIGIDEGQVSLSQTTTKLKVGGLPVVRAQRLQAIAQGGQILVTARAFNDARSVVLAEMLDLADLRWELHGEYLLKGLHEVVEVGEVGGPAAPMTPPKEGARGEGDTITGWRPAKGEAIPQRPNWIIDRKLGEGGFGEVWRAKPAHGMGYRVFKFCFQRERLKALKREVKVLKHLTAALGDRNDIATMEEWHFEDPPPYWLEFRYAEGGNLLEWVAAQGTFANVPMSLRLEIVAKIADALAAAHKVGVVHKDVKPSNVLIVEEAGNIRVRLLDFGLGWVSPERLRQFRTSRSTIPSEESTSSSWGGTAQYMAPELTENRGVKPTEFTDIYSLGVLLYKMAVGTFQGRLEQGYDAITNPLLRNDIQRCVRPDPRDRPSAVQLAKQLRDLPERFAKHNARRRDRVVHDALRHLHQVDAQRRRRLGALVAFAVLAGTLALSSFTWRSISTIANEMGSETVVTSQSQLIENMAAAAELAEVLEFSLTTAVENVQTVARDPKIVELVAALAGPVPVDLDASDDLVLPGTVRPFSKLDELLLYFSRKTSRVIKDGIKGAADGASGEKLQLFQIYSWAIANREGHLLIRLPYDKDILGKNFAYRDWFHGRGTTDYDGKVEPIINTHISEPFVSRAYEHMTMISVSAPIKDGQETIGVLLGSLPLEEYLGRRYGTTRAGSVADLPPTYPIVIDHRGMIAIHPLNPIVERFLAGDKNPKPETYDKNLLDVLRARNVSGSTSHCDPILVNCPKESGAETNNQIIGVATFTLNGIEAADGESWIMIIQTSDERLVAPWRLVRSNLEDVKGTTVLVLVWVSLAVVITLTVSRLRIAKLSRAIRSVSALPAVRRIEA